MDGEHDLVKIFGAVLDLCKLDAGESMAVLTQGGERDAYAAAYLAAAQDRGAQCFQVNIPKVLPQPGVKNKRTSLTGNQAAMEALKRADLLIDLVGLLWSAEQKEIQDSGTRILMCREPIENLVKLFPRVDLRRRVEAGAARLAAAKRMHITSPGGTDVTYELGQYPVITQYGYTDTPGRWDHLAGGFLFTGARDGGVNGTVVIDAGDIILPWKRYVASPVRLQIEKGMIVAIDGAGADAALMRDFVARFNDPRAYAVSHVGWGMDEKAQWDFLATSPLAAQSNGLDARAFYGNVLFSTGPNNELGGSNDTACHLDIPLRGCSLTLDNEPIVSDGRLVPDDLRVAGR